MLGTIKWIAYWRRGIELQRRTHIFFLFIDLPFWKMKNCEQLGRPLSDAKINCNYVSQFFADDATCETFIVTRLFYF